jgi:hypothetical protein
MQPRRESLTLLGGKTAEQRSHVRGPKRDARATP